MMCADCAYALPDPAPQPKPESTKDILLKLQDAIQDINAMVQVPSSPTLKHQAKCLEAGALLKELIMRAGR